jgi:hypothetical protein
VKTNTNEFLCKFNETYNELYERKDAVKGMQEAVQTFDRFLAEHKTPVAEFVRFRGDFISSDREAAAFVYTCQAFGLI